MATSPSRAGPSPSWCCSPLTHAAATGCWVVAHECGHGAFTRHRWLEDAHRYDPTPIATALWRVVTRCNLVSESDVGWRFVIPERREGA